ncbi:hypothetical protein CGH62_23350 [Vibrio parahaemolyticus]|nr:hypothetical protein CGH62_23350 [Vibrio parahaemolyticus]
MVKDRIALYPSSGEINFKVENAQETIARIENFDWQESFEISRVDGLDIIFDKWRLNLRSSNTEPVIRLNVETQSDNDLLQSKLNQLIAIIKE